jgi:hypothetical protein
MRNIADNSPVSSLRFTASQKTAIYTQAEMYALIQYSDPSELEGLKIFSDNRTWRISTPADGLVNNAPTPTRLIPVFWKAFSTLQPGLAIDAQTESSWKLLKDQNQTGFATLDPSNIVVPAFSGQTYIYFAAKMNSGTASAFYTTPLTVSNYVNVSRSGAPSPENGFGTFSQMYRPGQEPPLQIPLILGQPSTVTLDIYDRHGSKIKNLFSGPLPAGTSIISWDGLAEDGTVVPSGLYLLTPKIGDKKYKAKKLAVIR